MPHWHGRCPRFCEFDTQAEEAAIFDTTIFNIFPINQMSRDSRA